jgi:hypothetical protein
MNRSPILPTTTGDVVIVAKVESEKSMVVIERIEDHLYSMCTLKKDLKVKEVRLVARKAKDTENLSLRNIEDNPMQIDSGEWWTKLMVHNINVPEKRDRSLQFLINDVTKTEFELPK